MAAWWKPTADGYFRHVSKAVILEAVVRFAPSHAPRLAKLKKGDIASEAERLAEGTGWMPALFMNGFDTAPKECAQAEAGEGDAPDEPAGEVTANALAA